MDPDRDPPNTALGNGQATSLLLEYEPGPADGELTVIPCKLPFLRRDGDF